MVELYNTTNITGDVLGIIKGVDSSLSGVPLLSVLMVIFLVLFFGMMASGVTRSALTSGLITSLIGILLTLSGIVSTDYLPVFIILLALVGGSSIIYKKNQGGDI